MDLGGDIHATNNHRINLMHVSAQGDQATSIVFLQKQGLDINSRDLKNSTPLHWASYAGAETAIVYLLAFGAKVNARDVEGHTPLHLAVKSAEENKNTRTVKHLLLSGADRNIRVRNLAPLNLFFIQDHRDKKAIDIAEEIRFENVQLELVRLLVGIPDLIIVILCTE